MDKQLYRILISLVCFFFLLGVAAGSLMASKADAESGSRLFIFLTGYKESLAAGSAWVPIWQSFLNAFLFPILAFLSGLTLFGVLTLPILLVVRGFMLSFSFTAFISAFGVNGFWLALGEFGIQCLLGVPCLMILATYGAHTALQLAGIASGHARPGLSVFNKTMFVRLGACSAALTVCALLDFYLSPPLQGWLSALL